MEVPYVEGLATRDGPESCAGAREGAGEALTGEPVGRVLSRENPIYSGVLTAWTCRKATLLGSRSREPGRPHAVVDLAHASEAPRTGTGRSQGRLVEEGRRGRTGKSKDAIP
jgi:hypothetical protein